MRIAIGADHAGFALKEELMHWLQEKGHHVEDMGALSLEPSDDYPDWALRVAEAVAAGHQERGIVVCGSGVGACIVANKVQGIRAGTCHDTYSAHQGVEHDSMNVLCLGSRVIGGELAREVAQAFLAARFSGDDRHRRRLRKLQAIEERALRGRSGGATP